MFNKQIPFKRCSYSMVHLSYIILYDSSCNLCQKSVRFIKRYDKRQLFSFMPFGSNDAGLIVSRYGVSKQYKESMVFVLKGKVYTKSTAALLICWHLSGFWPILSIFLLIPTPIRDFFYDIIARNRYRWFGKCESCVTE